MLLFAVNPVLLGVKSIQVSKIVQNCGNVRCNGKICIEFQSPNDTLQIYIHVVESLSICLFVCLSYAFPNESCDFDETFRICRAEKDRD